MGMAALAMIAWMFWDGVRAGFRNPDSHDRESLFPGLAVAGVVWAVTNLFTPVMVRESGPLVMIVLGLLWQGRKVESTAAQAARGPLPWARPAEIAVVLGIILGPIADGELIRTYQRFDGDLTVFFTRPISLAFVIMSVLGLAFPYVVKKAKKE